jgi:endonuclease-3
MDALVEKTADIAAILEQTLGIPQRQTQTHDLSPLDNLMLTILSQNTNDVNRDKAYQMLRARFPTWENVMEADLADITNAIRIAGLANQKSQRIQAILAWIYTHYGALNLDFICDLDPQDAIDTFCHLKGIGIKTIAVVLAFSCGVDIFPVDTHVHRLCNRIGLVKPQTKSAEQTFHLMQDRVPEGKAYSFHINLIRHGRTICKARKPLCPKCSLNTLCDYYMGN